MRPLILALVLSAASATAQPTLTVATNMPTAGVANTLYRAASASPGPSGANQTWDFTNLAHNTTANSNYAACPGASGCNPYPSATLSGYEALTGGTVYYDASGSALSIVGGSAYGVSNVTFTDPEDQIRFPMSFNTTYNDAMRATFTMFGQNFSRTGTSTITADAWGTLKLPYGLTVNDVLRVKRVGSYTDSVGGAQFGAANVTTYAWYSTAHKEFLLFIINASVPGGGTGSAVAYTLPGISLDIEENSARSFAVTASPNPAQDRITVQWAGSTEATLSLQDLTGRTVLQGRGRGEASLDVASLPRGLYLLRTKDAKGAVSTQKISLR